MKAVALLIVVLCSSWTTWGQVLEAGMFAGVSNLQNGVIGSDTISSNAAASSKIKLTN